MQIGGIAILALFAVLIIAAIRSSKKKDDT